MKILYITRTFGPVGGMERYAFEVARDMVRRGHQVSALCRSVDESSVAGCGVKVIRLSTRPTKRGWEDRYAFRDAVTDYLIRNKQHATFDIIHSHENTVEQHVTTEHGPCTAHGLRLKPWKYFDFSALKNLAIEKQKFQSPHLRAVVCCSQRVHGIAIREYPRLAAKDIDIIPPAFTYLSPREKSVSQRPRVVGFIGADWKRKGLIKAIEIFRLLRREDARWVMLIAGCAKDALPIDTLKTLPQGAEFLGRTDPRDFYARVNLLLHPAVEEPFGMVISEALSCGVPVLCSDQCGAVEHLTCGGLHVLPLKDPISVWAEFCNALVGRTFASLAERRWSDVAEEYEDLYKKVCFH